MRRAISNVIQAAFRVIGLDVQRASSLWTPDSRFAGILREIRGYTLVSADRCFMIHQLARHAARLPGDMAEVGV